ncbi:MAG: hypothetical protein OK454_09260, partial [Thaumarchaeota archaeon]|nr:hypothetical protein [Nitrososphaerota archaeon]
AADELQEGQEELSPEDRRSLMEGTAEIQSMLGDEASKVTVRQIQDALWHYYYDIDKSIAYLMGKYIAPPAPNATKAAAKRNSKGGETGLSFGAPLSAPAQACRRRCIRSCQCPGSSHRRIRASEGSLCTARQPSLTPCQGQSTCRPESVSRPSFADFFLDMPWLDIPKHRETTFIPPAMPRGGLLGGSGVDPKMSKLQALAAARKKKGVEKKPSDDAAKPTEERLRDLSLAEKQPLRENVRPALTGLSKRRKLGEDSSASGPLLRSGGSGQAPTGSIRSKAAAPPMGLDEPAQDPASRQELDELADDTPTPEPAQPSAFAQTLLGTAEDAPRAPPMRSFMLPWMAFRDDIANAFSEPSPDEVVLAAQSKGSLTATKGKK